MDGNANSEIYDAWHPGIKTHIPLEYAHLRTVVRPENVFNTAKEIRELSHFMGVAEEDVVRCRPERLVLHETLLRVMCEVKTPEGEDYTGLGTNFRATARNILEKYVMPHMDEFNAAYEEVRRNAEAKIHEILDSTLFAKPAPPVKPSKTDVLKGWFDFSSRALAPKNSVLSVEEQNTKHAEDFKQRYLAAQDPLERSVYKNLFKVVSALTIRHGRIGSYKDIITSLTSARVCNEYGSQILGEKAEPYIWEGIKGENCQTLSPADHPVVISLKGASASGKSSLRLAINRDPESYLGADTSEDIDNFAVISPDVCRKMLLDYNSLGEAYKYAGTMTADELALIDRKIDRYLRDKMQSKGQINNMVIDRFRFDTFNVIDVDESVSFFSEANKLQMFFVVTAPENLVERGWIRGLETGRYRATEDFLALGKEAYLGIPKKFFQWIEAEDTNFEYRFLNNNVPKGTPFLEAGYGTREHLTVVDIETFVNINKYAKADIRAANADALYDDPRSCDVKGNTDFLMRCAEKIPVVDFVDAQTMRPYARVEKGSMPKIMDADVFLQKAQDPLNRTVFAELGFMRLPQVRAAFGEHPASPTIF